LEVAGLWPSFTVILTPTGFMALMCAERAKVRKKSVQERLKS